MEKILSVIVPSYNMEKYLPKCLGTDEDAVDKKVECEKDVRDPITFF